MKQTIRMNTFETNSSSTHNSIICSKEDWEKFKNGEMYTDWRGKLTPKEELIKKCKDSYEENNHGYYDIEEYMVEYSDVYTYDMWTNDDYLETDITEFKTVSGDEIVIACKYGFDG